MGCCVLEKCCYCISLRTGSLFIAYLALLLSLLHAATYTMFLIARPFESEEAEYKFTIIATTLLTIEIFAIFFDISLLIGVYTENASLILFNIIASLCYMFANLLALSVWVATFAIGAGNLSGSLLSHVITLYCLLVLYSYYLELNAED